MAPWTASAILQDLRGPVKQGTARAANSVHALVYGKTGTSSRNEDALFVGLTEDFAGSFWLGHDRPRPMPGINGGGAPAKAFAKLTDFYYVKRAQARWADSRREASGPDPLARFRQLDPERQWAFMAGSFLMLLIVYLMLQGALRRRERQPHTRGLAAPPEDLQPRQAPVETS